MIEALLVAKRMRRMVVLLVATVIGAGCGGSSSGDGGSSRGGGGSSPLSGHVNESAVQNCVENGNDEATCREIWTVK
jgi:hypothetical protein